MNIYAAYNNDTLLRHKSSSGGIFSLLATKFDIIYGVSLDRDWNGASFTRIDNGDITSLRGSKYIQAKLGDTLKKVKIDLDKNYRVLFTGLGCQINGLHSFLQKKYDNLTTVDLICHGVPSPKLWKSYVLYQKQILGEINNIQFRDKTLGWRNYCLRINNNLFQKNKDPYFLMFLNDFCLRPSCYSCKAKSFKTSDITLGDFWGIEKIAPELDDDKGTSLIIIRTINGQKLFDSVKEQLTYKNVDYQQAVKANSSEYKSVLRPYERDLFYQDLNQISFDKLIFKYANYKKYYIKQQIKKTIKKVVNIINVLRKRDI